ncbi:MAG: GAF domain-containing protein [Candidatus Dormibacteria bacterium]
MAVAPIPLDEDARLESLRELWLLDTEPEERFDRITRMAQRLFEVPIAAFALVDSERVWFKSRIGLDIPELQRGDAFCSHAILTDGIIQVEDAAVDPRFRDSPIVTTPPGVRFYAGYPVRSAERRRVGVLAIMDTEPRVLGPTDLKSLTDLARGIEGEISATRTSTADELTGMLNLRGFHQFADKLLKMSARSGKALSLLYVDVLNPRTSGTPRDRQTILKQVADIINQTFRQSDVLARIGPARFCALLPENADHTGEKATARLQTAMRAWNMEPNIPFQLDVVASGARYDPANPVSLDQLMIRAETSVGAMRAVRQLESG